MSTASAPPIDASQQADGFDVGTGAEQLAVAFDRMLVSSAPASARDGFDRTPDVGDRCVARTSASANDRLTGQVGANRAASFQCPYWSGFLGVLGFMGKLGAATR